LTKPVDLRELLALIRRLLGGRPKAAPPPAGFDPFVGQSVAIRELAARAHLVAASDRPTLILGETGSGKGVLARWLASHSPRAGAPFVDLNCAGLSPSLLESELFGHERGAFTGATGRKEGLFEAAHGGTLFLDEFGGARDLAANRGSSRPLRSSAFAVSATFAPSTSMYASSPRPMPTCAIACGTARFRPDLYFRVSTMELAIPPLRDRREDILPLARQLLGSSATMSADAVARLGESSWPGNIRELANVLERARMYANGGEITAAHIVLDRSGASSGQGDGRGEHTWPLDEVERKHIERAIAVSEGQRRRRGPRSSAYLAAPCTTSSSAIADPKSRLVSPIIGLSLPRIIGPLGQTA